MKLGTRVRGSSSTLAAALALLGALALGSGPAAAQAPAIGDVPHRPKPSATTAPNKKSSGLPVRDLATEAKAYDNLEAYGLELDVLRQLHDRTPADADLELWMALCEARLGHPEAAWERLQQPVVKQAENDSMPPSRRHDYQNDRDQQWLNGSFDGWHWYLARARAELGIELQHWQEAHQAARAAVAARPLSGKEWLLLAIAAGHDGDLAESRQAALQAAFLDPTLPEAQYLAGLFEWRDGHRADAQERFRGAVALDSTYQPAAAALVRAQLPFSRVDSLPSEFLAGARAAGMLTRATGPKLEESIQMERPAVITRHAMAALPDSMLAQVPRGEMALPVLVDARGRIVLHELPWVDGARLPGGVISVLLSSLPSWRFNPAFQRGQPVAGWTAIPFSFNAAH